MAETLIPPAASSAPTADSENPPKLRAPATDIRVNVPFVVTLLEAAGVLTMSKRAVADLVASGKLPSKRIGRRRIIFRTALESFLGTKLA